MGMKKILKTIKKELEKSRNEGWSVGYEAGYETADSVADDRVDFAFKDGVEKEQRRIQEVIRMNIQWATESGRGSEIVFWNKAKEILTPVEVDYSDEAYYKELEKDGF